MNLVQFAGPQLRKLGRDLLTPGIKSSIGAVAGLVGTDAAQILNLAGQGIAQCGAAGHKGLVQSEQNVSSCHSSPPRKGSFLPVALTQRQGKSRGGIAPPLGRPPAP